MEEDPTQFPNYYVWNVRSVLIVFLAFLMCSLVQQGVSTQMQEANMDTRKTYLLDGLARQNFLRVIHSTPLMSLVKATIILTTNISWMEVVAWSTR